MLPLSQETQAQRTAPAVDGLRLINELRLIAMSCRAMPRTDLFKACALLQITPGATRMACAEALMRGLAQALGQRPHLFAPGSAELSFDENWLMAVMTAARRQDEASLAFLIRSRIAPEYRRQIGYLARQVSITP